jgi:hypothetical protein
MKFILNRDKTICSTQGHAIAFVQGVPTHVPPAMWADVQAAGGVPESALPEAELAPSREPADPAARTALIFATFAQLVQAGRREDFTGNGMPHVKVLEAALGFRIDNKERDALWQQFRLKDAEA